MHFALLCIICALHLLIIALFFVASFLVAFFSVAPFLVAVPEFLLFLPLFWKKKFTFRSYSQLFQDVLIVFWCVSFSKDITKMFTNFIEN